MISKRLKVSNIVLISTWFLSIVSGDLIAAATAAGGLAAAGYTAATLAGSGSISGASDESDSSDFSNSYADGSVSTSDSSRICGGAGGSASSDSSSGFNCCPDDALLGLFNSVEEK